MKRIEQWLVILVFFHAVMLLGVQWLLLHTDMGFYIHPIYEYFGVNQEYQGEILETIDRIFQDVLSF
ncbi:hypothetical protein GLW05_03855 [Pontibacillus yanchengensis]|uniref:Uncharacterized protein n=1 Tax=Pontibacillus yanchengensis TaxID=462910 RepID=A0A6I4ZVG7_9BACI|nr:DUF5359 family protein [Pontibacillus yanchengensis]MYL32726.1 hypothetical protein [Pontibacillus yanchengensis]